MSVTGILLAAAMVGAVGIFVGLFLGVAGIKFKVEVDEKEEAVLGALPGYNCGGCGFSGCAGLAAAIAKGEAPVNGCPVGGGAVAEAISAIMGVDATGSERMTAYVACNGNCEVAKKNYEYVGVMDCRMAALSPGGGPKGCGSGCMGLGTCVKECPFDAISIKDGIAVVDKEKCMACSKCIAVCPKHLISLIPYKAKVAVACSSTDKGPVVMKVCSVGCIGCGLCVRACPKKAVTVTDFHATIDQSACVGCGLCVQKCPKKAIEKF